MKRLLFYCDRVLIGRASAVDVQTAWHLKCPTKVTSGGARHHINDTARRTRVRNYVQACMLARAVGAPTLSSRADVRLSFFGRDYCGFGQFGVITIVRVLLKHQFFLRTDGRFVRVRVLRCI